MTAKVRLLDAGDLDAVCEIVNHYIMHSTIHWSTQPDEPEHWRHLWEAGRERFPWLVAEVDGEVAGLAYAAPFKTRAAYDWCVESTIYLRSGLHRQGIGKALYTRLFELLDAQGFTSVIAGVAVPNEASIGLHESFGFTQSGYFPAVGYKFGQWLDLVNLQRLRARPASPSAPLPVAAVL